MAVTGFLTANAQAATGDDRLHRKTLPEQAPLDIHADLITVPNAPQAKDVPLLKDF